jgi:Domain of unknown function (DUF397)
MVEIEGDRNLAMAIQDDYLSNALWQKSRKSAADGNCVECALNFKPVVLIRDSKSPDDIILAVNRVNWDAFICDVKNGRCNIR